MEELIPDRTLLSDFSVTIYIESLNFYGIYYYVTTIFFKLYSHAPQHEIFTKLANAQNVANFGDGNRLSLMNAFYDSLKNFIFLCL